MKNSVKKVIVLVMTLAMLLGALSINAFAAKISTPLTTSFTLSGPGNDGGQVSMPAGWAGMKITVGDNDIVVTHIGRIFTDGSNLTHNFFIVTTDGTNVVNGVQTVATTETPKDQFLYAELSQSVTLSKNTSYYVMSDYWGTNDKFYSASTTTTTTAASIDGIVILGQTYEFYAAPGTGWGPLDIKYEVENPGTGDNANVIFYIAAMALAAGVLVVTCSKKYVK